MGTHKSESGLLSLEASVAVSTFLFLMLFLYSFFVYFEARNTMAHVLLSSTKSMSLDSYANEALRNSGDLTQFIMSIYDSKQTSYPDNGFVSNAMWGHIEKGNEPQNWNGDILISQLDDEETEDIYGELGKPNAAISPLLEEIIKKRFVAYLGNGDEATANRMLQKRYHVVEGLDGLDFSQSKISSGKLYLNVRYTVELEFNFFGFGRLKQEQSACSKIW